MLWSGLALPTTVIAAPATESLDRDQTAHCVAAMQTHADALARLVKAGDMSQEPALRTELERAAALIGRTYLDGLHDEDEAKARLKKAQEAQAGWSDERRRRVHEDCVRRADAELAAANGFERFIVRRVADRRLRRMLAAR
jgi:hypothetical protein